MSLAAWPVYAYTRRLAPEGYALLAAALTLACPLVLLLGIRDDRGSVLPARGGGAARVGPRRRDRPAHGPGDRARADRSCGRDARPGCRPPRGVRARARRRRRARATPGPTLRRFWPIWSLAAAAVLVAAVLPGAFGAYEAAVNGSYSAGPAARLTYDHLGFLILTVGIVPAGALVLSLVEAARGRDTDAATRALVAVTASAVVLVTLQVGTFSSRFSPHLLGRDLAALPPIVFAVFAVWLGRGGRRPRVATSLSAVGLLAILATVPWNDLVTPDALPDSLGIAILLDDPLGWKPATVVAILGALLLLVFVFAPRLELIAIGVLLLLGWGTIAASARVQTATAEAQVALVGEPRDWIDRAVTSDVAYVYNGDLAAGRSYGSSGSGIHASTGSSRSCPTSCRARSRNARSHSRATAASRSTSDTRSRTITCNSKGRPSPTRCAARTSTADALGAAAARPGFRCSSPARSRTATSPGQAVVNAFNCAGGTLRAHASAEGDEQARDRPRRPGGGARAHRRAFRVARRDSCARDARPSPVHVHDPPRRAARIDGDCVRALATRQARRGRASCRRCRRGRGRRTRMGSARGPPRSSPGTRSSRHAPTARPRRRTTGSGRRGRAR